MCACFANALLWFAGGHALATQLAADRGLSWEGALERYQEEVERLRDLGQDPAQSASGFYVDGIRKDQGRTGELPHLMP